MGRLLRAELIKLTTTKTALGIGAAAVAIVGLAAISIVNAAAPSRLAGPLHGQDLFVLASVNLGLLALLLGIRVTTDEIRYGSIVPTLLVAPDRRRVLAAKVMVSASAGAVLGVVAVAAMVALTAIAFALRSIDLTVTAGDVAGMAGLVGAAALWTVIGAAGGAIVRHQVAAVVMALVWVLVLENLGASWLGDAGRFLPGQAAHALARATQAGNLLGPVAGGALLTAYASAAVGVAAFRLAKVEV